MTTFRFPLALAMTVSLTGPALTASGLSPELVSKWTAYIAATEQRIQHELRPDGRFLALDFPASAAADRRAVLAGAIPIWKVETVDDAGHVMRVPHALVHHWRGAVFIAGQSVARLLERLESDAPDIQQEDVLQSKVLERGPDSLRIFLKLQRSKIVTVVYNTEHVVAFTRYGTLRASSASTATKIAELEAPGTSRERELPAGEDRGFLWKWNAYWRYEEVSGGVIAECESVSLSRDVPAVVRFLANPLIEHTARESMVRTLSALRGSLARTGAIKPSA